VETQSLNVHSSRKKNWDIKCHNAYHVLQLASGFVLIISFASESHCCPSKMVKQLLSQADGYGLIIGLSVVFCLIILAAVRIQKRYLAEDSDQSEMFMVANRSVGTGLTASAVFSSWYYCPVYSGDTPG
jgi:hypothetical protein